MNQSSVIIWTLNTQYKDKIQNICQDYCWLQKIFGNATTKMFKTIGRVCCFAPWLGFLWSLSINIFCLNLAYLRDLIMLINKKYKQKTFLFMFSFHQRALRLHFCRKIILIRTCWKVKHKHWLSFGPFYLYISWMLIQHFYCFPIHPKAKTNFCKFRFWLEFITTLFL